MKRHSFFNMLLMAFVMMASCPQAWALDGIGTAEDPYLIQTAADMLEFADIVNGTNGQKRNTSACAKLMADIPDLGEWTPIGNSSGHFKGTFDGQGHRIDGMTITNYTQVNQGLFGYIENATIKDFRLSGQMTSNTKINGGENDCSGTVVGRAIGSSAIRYVMSSVDLTVSKEQKHLGGIVGQIEDECQVLVCEYSGTLDAGPSKDCIGGIVGFMHADSNAEIRVCCYIGHIKSTANGPTIGGILGYVNSINGPNKSLGKCLSAGEFSYTGSDQYVNAIIGRARKSSTLFQDNGVPIHITDLCFYDGKKYRAFNESAEVDVSGGLFLKYTENIQWGYAADQMNSFAGVENLWRQELGKDYAPSTDPEKPIVYKHEILRCGYRRFETYYTNDTKDIIYHSDLVKVEQRDPVGCTYGYKEHYKCPTCRKLFDEAITIHSFGSADGKPEDLLTGIGEYTAYIPPVEEHHWNLDSTYCDRCGHGFVRVKKANKANSIFIHEYNWKSSYHHDPCDYDYATFYDDPESPIQTFEMTGKILNLPEHKFENEDDIVELYAPCTVIRVSGYLFSYGWESEKNVELHSIPGFVSGTTNYVNGRPIPMTLRLCDDSYVDRKGNKNMLEFSSIQYTRQQEFEWGTLCVPFELDMDDQECTFYNLVDVEDDVLVLEEAHGKLPLGTPIIYHVTPDLLADGPFKLTFHACTNNVDASTSLALPAVKGLIPTGHYDSRIMTPEDGYMLSKESFRDQLGLEDGETVTQGPFRCTLERADTSSPAKVRAFTLRVRDTGATGILEVAEPQSRTPQYYSIDGKRLAQPQKGLNIVRKADGTWRKEVVE